MFYEINAAKCPIYKVDPEIDYFHYEIICIRDASRVWTVQRGKNENKDKQREKNKSTKEKCSVFLVSGLFRNLISILQNTAAPTAISTKLRENMARSVYHPVAVIRNHTD